MVPPPKTLFHMKVKKCHIHAGIRSTQPKVVTPADLASCYQSSRTFNSQLARNESWLGGATADCFCVLYYFDLYQPDKFSVRSQRAQGQLIMFSSTEEGKKSNTIQEKSEKSVGLRKDFSMTRYYVHNVITSDQFLINNVTMQSLFLLEALLVSARHRAARHNTVRPTDLWGKRIYAPTHSYSPFVSFSLACARVFNGVDEVILVHRLQSLCQPPQPSHPIPTPLALSLPTRAPICRLNEGLSQDNTIIFLLLAHTLNALNFGWLSAQRFT